MINNTNTKNEYTTTGNLATMYPITFQGSTDKNGYPKLHVVLTDASTSVSKTLLYNIGYGLVFDEVVPDLDESLNAPAVQGIKLLGEEDAVAGNHLVIERDTPFVQPIDFQVGRIDPEQIERGFDLSVLRDQELKTGTADLKDYVDVQDAAVLEVANDADEKADYAVETAEYAKTLIEAANEHADEALELANTFDGRITTLENNTYLHGYIHDQAEAATTWVVNHNLGHHPSGIRVLDSSGSQVEWAVKDLNENTCELYFNAPFTGTAYLN